LCTVASLKKAQTKNFGENKNKPHQNTILKLV